jgi:hypothetical protein
MKGRLLSATSAAASLACRKVHRTPYAQRPVVSHFWQRVVLNWVAEGIRPAVVRAAATTYGKEGQGG